LRISGVVALGAVLLCACANPTRRADALAVSLDFSKQIETGAGFRHVVYRNARATRDGVLHVYIEGDGTPFRQRDIIAADPTPSDPLMLRLMALDSARSIYLGRPCYFELYRDQDCSAAFWTHRRYGPEVLDSMEAVLRAETDKAGATRVALFGHSGGGTLAVLLAQRVNAVTRVVTIGANLDVPAWCALHHFTPLDGSLNPADRGPSRPGLNALHLVGEDDSNTPPSLVQAAARERGGEPVRVVAHFDHRCCWGSVWPGILREDP
jgi:hypothetical protein